MLDRREFLTIAAATAIPAPRRKSCLLMTDNALAVESLRGYRRCVDLEPTRNVPIDARLIIVPGVRILSGVQWLALRSAALGGASVIIESGLAFASPDETASHRAHLQDHFGISIGPDLSRAVPNSFHYIRYHWPVELLVRDFSETAVVQPGNGEPIGVVVGRVVAIKQSLGLGTVIYLGSPLGPALLAGDAQARTWVENVVQYTS